MFVNDAELRKYVVENFADVTDNRLDGTHWDLECTRCKIRRGFQLIKKVSAGEVTEYGQYLVDFTAPLVYIFRCPVCGAFKQWICYDFMQKTDGGMVKHYYRVTSVPNEGLEEIEELPVDPPSLRVAYRQAIRAKDANAPLAAAAMFRRALQIITRDVLKVKPGTLASELMVAVGKTFNEGTVSQNFANVGYIVKEAGNQGAHPDSDPDLLDFTAQDAEDLQNIFMELVSELFVVPAAKEKAKAEFLARKKIKPRP